MNCERIREQIPEALAGRLNKADRDALVEHREGCAGCRAEVAELNAVWRGLETVKSGMDDAAPDSGAKVRFQEMLAAYRSEEHTSELQSLRHLVCRLLLEKKNTNVLAQHDPPYIERPYSTADWYLL